MQRAVTHTCVMTIVIATIIGAILRFHNVIYRIDTKYQKGIPVFESDYGSGDTRKHVALLADDDVGDCTAYSHHYCMSPSS